MPFIALALFLIYLVYRLETIDSKLTKVLEQLPPNDKKGRLIGSIPEGPK